MTHFSDIGEVPWENDGVTNSPKTFQLESRDVD